MGMAHGYAGMASFVSLQMGLVWVIGSVILFAGAYLIGSTKGGRAAAKYTATITWFFVVGFAAIVGYAYFVGEAQRFLENYPYTVAIEMFLLALGCVWIMWFMATQYSRGRIAIDERFGSKENYLRAKEAAKRASRDTLQQGMQQDSATPIDPTVAAPAVVGDAAVTAAGADMTNVMPAVDPATGMPINPAAASAVPTIDPTTGAPMMIDPQTGQPMQTPAQQPVPGMPAAAAAVPPAIDPATGMPVNPAAPNPVAQAQVAQMPAAPVPAVDPLTGQPVPQQPAPAAAAPAIDPYTGQPLQAPQTGQPGQVPPPAAPAVAASQPGVPAPAVSTIADQGPLVGTPDFAIPGAAAQAAPEGASSSQDMFAPLPLGPSAPNVMPESNEQWLQQLEPSATEVQGMDLQAPAPLQAPQPGQPGQFDPFAQPVAPVAPAVPAVDPYTGQPVMQQPVPAAVPPQFDPFGQPVPQQPAPAAAAPAIDPYTGQPLQAPQPGQPGQVPLPAVPGNPYGY
ncbi:MAG: hypothetical protein FWE48_01095 [Coriobacteriia bacterium]|nr:hypothetical protein [Coriobacteriia bacterium]